jgi:hypothetical protein
MSAHPPIASIVLLAMTACATTPGQPSGTVVEAFEGVTVQPAGGVVEVKAFVCLDGGWLEQVACSPDTREHEALLVIEARPSNLHAALLMAGFEPGTPGQWSYDGGTVAVTPPTGDTIEILVRYQTDGQSVQEPIGVWMVGAKDDRPFPDGQWVFAGSSLAENPGWMGPGEHYVADLTGSIIGLVTFGDEVIGYERVMADQEAVEATQWRVNTGHVPPIGTPVTIILRATSPGP